MNRGEKVKKGYIFIIFTTIFFSSMEIALKIFSNDYNPIQMSLLRFIIGSLILLPLAIKNLKARKVSLKKEDFKFFALTGFICIVVSMSLFQIAILYSPASTVAVLLSCNTVFVIIFAHILLREMIHRHHLLSVVISMIGIVVIANPTNITKSFTGVMLTLLAAITFALYGVVGRTRSARYGGIAFTCFSFILGSIELLVLVLLTHIHPIAILLERAGFSILANIPILPPLELNSLLGLAYVGIFVTGLGYTFYFRAMEETSAITASLVFYIKPVLAPILAFLILSEPIPMSKTLGIILILTGSLISLLPSLIRQKQLRKGT